MLLITCFILLQQIHYLQNNFTLVFKDMLASYNIFFFSNKQSTTNVNATVLRTAVGSVQDLISKKKKFNDKPHKTGLTKKRQQG